MGKIKIFKLKKTLIIILAILTLLFFWKSIDLSLLFKNNLQRKTASKIINELKQMKEEGKSQSDRNKKWQEYKDKRILTKEVESIVYDLISEEKQRDFLSK